MKAPLIGVTMDSGDRPDRYQVCCDYTTSVEKAGGIPFPLPYRTGAGALAGMLDLLDGVLFTGGDDLDPALFGEPRHPKAIAIDPQRQQFELTLLAEVEKRRIPALGICLGCQVMNIHRGGSLHQFLPDVPRPEPIEHRRLDRDLPRHPVRIDPQSIIGRAIGKAEVSANTYHKQAIARLGRGLRATAHAPDGIVEGIEDPTLPLFAAVQWHPERLSDEPEHLAVFKLLVERAGQ